MWSRILATIEGQAGASLTVPTGVFGIRPVIIRLWPPPWSLKSCEIERMSENRSATFVCSGKSSVTSMPGTLVFTGLKSPRYSAGASGFMS